MHKSPSTLPGLIASWRLRDGEAPEPLGPVDAMNALADRESGIWLHLDLAEPRARDLCVRLPIPAVARRTLIEPDDVPHLDAADGAVYGAVTDFQQGGPAASIPETALLHVVLTPELLITGQTAALRTPNMVGRDARAGSPAAVLAQVLHLVADAMGEAVHFFANRLSRIEDSLLNSGGTAVDRQALAVIRRGSLRLERAFAPTADTLLLWAEDPIGTAAEPFCAPLLREARSNSSVRRGLAAVQERARITQDELAGLATEETNRRLFVLAVMSAAILPATLITGVFGMNVGAVPDVDREWGFVMAMALIAFSIAVVLAGLRYWKLL